MVTRTSSQQVTFRRPFLLSGLDSLQPAGTYTAEIEEELLETLSMPAWKRTATVILLSHGGATEYHAVDPDELQKALLRDAAQPEQAIPAGGKSRIHTGRTRAAMNMLWNRGRPKRKL
jgi:hypothetical protein